MLSQATTPGFDAPNWILYQLFSVYSNRYIDIAPVTERAEPTQTVSAGGCHCQGNRSRCDIICSNPLCPLMKAIQSIKNLGSPGRVGHSALLTYTPSPKNCLMRASFGEIRDMRLMGEKPFVPNNMQKTGGTGTRFCGGKFPKLSGENGSLKGKLRAGISRHKRPHMG